MKKGDTLWRNYDQQWEKIMARDTAVRKIPLHFTLSETADGFELKALVQGGNECSRLNTECSMFNVQCSMNYQAEHQLARTDQTAGIKEVLSKLGDTIYYAKDVEICFSQPWFIPRSLLADWRRSLIEKLMNNDVTYRVEVSNVPSHKVSAQSSCFNFNISNHLSQQFVADTCGTLPTDALEVTGKLADGLPLMTCRFCLRYQIGWCPQRHRVKSPYQEPFFLCSKDGRRFRLEFDCKKCEMKVFHA